MLFKFIKGTAVGAAAALIFCAASLQKLQPGEDSQPSAAALTCTEPTRESVPLDPYAVELVARTIWGEAEGVKSKDEQAAVAWCIFNRVDATGQTIEEVVTAPHQFQGLYRVEGEVPEHFIQLAEDVMTRWRLEQEGVEDVGRVLPKDYLYFIGDGERNHFSKEWKGSDYWDWSLESPY